MTWHYIKVKMTAGPLPRKSTEYSNSPTLWEERGRLTTRRRGTPGRYKGAGSFWALMAKLDDISVHTVLDSAKSINLQV